jgi:hypothetical protein
VEQQACPEQGWCVAVNMWYDMQFDSRYAAYKMVEALARQAGLVPAEDEEDEDEQAASSCESMRRLLDGTPATGLELSIQRRMNTVESVAVIFT